MMTTPELITVCGIGIGLAMDTFAISLPPAASIDSIKHALRMAMFFGGLGR
jgi:putative Mn2+ efflux pump MntP